MTIIRQIYKSAIAAFGGLLCWAFIENTALLRVSRRTVCFPGLPRIIQISDLHKRRFGYRNERLIRAVRQQKPEIIVITGDLISRTETDFSDTAFLLQELKSIAPVLMIPGNHESDLPDAYYNLLRQTAENSGVIWLENKTVTVCGIRFAGLALSPDYYRGGGLLGFRGAKRCTADTLLRLLGKCEPQTVLLAHDPLQFPAYAQWGAELTLSGHVHGGAVRLPLLGGLLSPERRFFPRYDKGYFRLGEAELFVSGGLGKLRLFNPPEICIITKKNTSERAK